MDSPERAVFVGSSQFLIDDSSSTSSAVVVRPPVLAAAQAFLTPRDERSKTEEAAIATARAGRIPPRSSREDGYYIAIPKPGGTHRVWPAMIAYLVTEMEVSGRAVSDQDLRQLKKWAHNQGAVLRRAAQASSDLSVHNCAGSTSQIARGAKKRAKKTSAVMTGVEEDRMPSVPVRELRGLRFFDPHGPPTEGDFASAGRHAAVQDSGEGGSTARIFASSRVDISVPSTVVEAPPGAAISIVATSAPTIRTQSVAPRGRHSEDSRNTIMQAEVILPAARRELESARAILDILASVRPCYPGCFRRLYRRLHCCCDHCPPPSWTRWRWRRPRGVVGTVCCF